MHYFTSHRRNTKRYFLNLDLPENPVCWALGHTPRARVADFRSAGKHVFIECVVCDRRYTGDRDMLRSAVDHLTPAERRDRLREIDANRVANAELDSKGFARGQVENRRQGFDGRTLNLGLELVKREKWGGLLHGPGFKLHFGGRGSETPFDGHIDTGKYAAYWQIGGIGGRFCEWLGRGHKRDLALSIHGGSLWWKLWYDGESGNDEHHRCDSWRTPKVWPWSAGRRKHRGWMCLRDGSIDLNPVDAFWGSKLWLRDENFAEQTVRALVPIGDFEGDEYEVDFTLERRTVRRKNGPAWAQRIKRVDYSADAKCRPGIPVRNHEWKGDEILGWNVNVTDQAVADGTWVREAVAATVELVRRDRRHYRYQPASV